MERDPRKQLGSRYGGSHEGVGEGRVGDQQQPFESRAILDENPLADVMGTPTRSYHTQEPLAPRANSFPDAKPSNLASIEGFRLGQPLRLIHTLSEAVPGHHGFDC
jgi:hypothetical protein